MSPAEAQAWLFGQNCLAVYDAIDSDFVNALTVGYLVGVVGSEIATEPVFVHGIGNVVATCVFVDPTFTLSEAIDSVIWHYSFPGSP
jgi:hypothetical protein